VFVLVVWCGVVYGGERRAKGGEEVPRGSGLLYDFSRARGGKRKREKGNYVWRRQGGRDKTRQDKTRQAASVSLFFRSNQVPRYSSIKVSKYPSTQVTIASQRRVEEGEQSMYTGTLSTVCTCIVYISHRGRRGGEGRGGGKGKEKGEEGEGGKRKRRGRRMWVT
jgi:hypothetical protein